MVLNFLGGGAAINAFARAGGIELTVVDIGVAAPLPVSSGLISHRVAAGTRNFCAEPAMTIAEMAAALEIGIQLAFDAGDAGFDLLGFGEMGIGNTTSASAIAAALTGESVAAVTGAGAGADDACMARKRSAIERALELHAANLDGPLAILRCIGGLEIHAHVRFLSGRRGSPRTGGHRRIHRDSRGGAGSAHLPGRGRISLCVASLGGAGARVPSRAAQSRAATATGHAPWRRNRRGAGDEDHSGGRGCVHGNGNVHFSRSLEQVRSSK